MQLESAIKAVLFDQPIAYHPILARVAGSVTAGLLLSQFLYWTPRSQDPEGWVWKSRDEILHETFLTRTEQETARRRLKEIGVLEEKLAGVPARLHFRINLSRLTELLASSQLAGFLPTSWQDSRQPDGGNAASKQEGNQPANSETTPENSQRLPLSNYSKGTRPEETQRDTPEATMVTPIAEPQRPSNGRPTRIGDVLAAQAARQPRASSRKGAPATEYLDTVIRDLSAELHDEEHTASNLAQARNLMAKAGLNEAAFVAKVYEARSITKQRGNIKKLASNGLRNRIPYMYAVLRDLLGLAEEDQPLLATEEEMQRALDIRSVDQTTDS